MAKDVLYGSIMEGFDAQGNSKWFRNYIPEGYTKSPPEPEEPEVQEPEVVVTKVIETEVIEEEIITETVTGSPGTVTGSSEPGKRKPGRPAKVKEEVPASAK